MIEHRLKEATIHLHDVSDVHQVSGGMELRTDGIRIWMHKGAEYVAQMCFWEELRHARINALCAKLDDMVEELLSRKAPCYG